MKQLVFIYYSPTKNIVMKKTSRKKYLPLLILFVSFTNAFSQVTLTGKITDKITNELLPGATIYIADLKTGAVSGINGHYLITNLPKRKFLVQVKFIGYSTQAEFIDLSITTTKDFDLSASAIEASEVVVTGSAFTTDKERSSVSVTSIDKIQLLSVTSDNLISAIAKTPGVSEITTGNNISKPVIRGLGYNRIITISKGIRQEGQQWGDEHGIEIDQFGADRIEVLKGPSSLLYGSDALGGVINILEPLPAPLNTVRGEFSTQYSTNNGLSANSLMLEGNHNGYVWRARGTYKNSAAYQTPKERVYNSAFNELNGEAFLGLSKKWGFSHLHFSKWSSNIGLVEGERDSITGKFTDSEGNIVSVADLNSRKLFLPNQNIRHTKISSVSSFYLKKSLFKINIGYQHNDRREFEDSKTLPGLYLHLTTYNYDVKYYLPEVKNIETVIGIQGMNQQNQNKGEEFLIPAYHSNDVGGFASIKKSYLRFTYNAGVRYDIRNIKGDKLIKEGDELFSSFNNTFSTVSGSAGSTYKISKILNVKGNIGRGFRAPNISELSANGIHEGTFRYEIGNTKLKPETSLQFDLAFTLETKFISAEVDGFYNLIDNFIYYRNINNEIKNIDGEEFPVYRYVQGDAELKGFEASVDIHPLDAIHFENSISYLQATNKQTNVPLPFIPATRIQNDLRYNFKNKKSSKLKETFIKVGLDNYLKQNNFDVFETQTQGYTLLNASIGTTIKLTKQHATVFINGTNITNKKYFNHLSRFKEVGIFNMGRNISIGINIPFGISNTK